MRTRGHALIKIFIVVPFGGSDSPAFLSLLVPSAVRILQGDALAAGNDFIRITTVEPESLDFGIGNDDESPFREGSVSDHFQITNGHIWGEHLNIFDDNGADPVKRVGGIRVDRFHYFPVVGPDEQDVVGFAAGRFYLRIDGDLSKTITEKEEK